MRTSPSSVLSNWLASRCTNRVPIRRASSKSSFYIGVSTFPHFEIGENALLGTLRVRHDDAIPAQQIQRIPRETAAVPEDLVVPTDPRGGLLSAQRGLETGIDVSVDEAKLEGGLDFANELID